MTDIVPLPIAVAPLIIAGPCSAESERQTLDTARALCRHGIKVFRAGLWKPRTLPGGFEGVGNRGLAWLRQVGRETGMLTATEVATPQHVHAAINAGVDILWVGARTSANPFAVQDIATALQGNERVMVLVKNPMSPDLNLWVGALQRFVNAGVKHIGAVHRGFSAAGQTLYRNDPQWHIAFELRRLAPKMTILCDPSHIGGKRELVQPLAQQAMDMGFDGLMIEAHCAPDKALSDRLQQITPDDLSKLLETLVVRSATLADDRLALLRQQIDDCDHELLALLARRMQVSREIGQFKKSNNLQVVQTGRYQQVLEDRVSQGNRLGLDSKFVQRIMQAVHEESVRQQVER